MAKSRRPVSASRDPDRGWVLWVPPGLRRLRYCCSSASMVVGRPSMTMVPRCGRPSAPMGRLTRLLNRGSRYFSNRSGGSMMCMSQSTNRSPSFMTPSWNGCPLSPRPPWTPALRGFYSDRGRSAMGSCLPLPERCERSLAEPDTGRGDTVAGAFERAGADRLAINREDMMPVMLGTGAYRYEVVDTWAKLPPGQEFDADVAAVGVDAQDRVYAFNRGRHPMVVFDRDGNFLRSWGEGVFHRPHGVHVAPDDTLWLTDDGDHTVRHCTLDGKVLLTLGIPGSPKPYMSGEPFHRCTHTALSPQGDLYVSDGYGNARIHKYTPDGKLVMSWGEPGTDPGQFNIPHNICCDPDGWLYVADRENHRVQVFDGNGKFETQWNNLHRPNGMCMAAGRDPLIYIGEGGPSGEINRDWPNIGPRVSIHTSKGKVLARLGKMHAGLAPGQFTSPHGIAVDGRGNIYVGELSGRNWRRFSKEPATKRIRVIHKLVMTDA